MNRVYFLLSWAAIFIVALWLRTGDVIDWYRQPHRIFYKEQPILLTFDGYYYLTQARDLTQGKYSVSDDLRGVPEPPSRPWPPPLLSIITAGVAAVTPFSLDWIATLLPPLLGILLAFPLYLLGNLYGGRLTGLTAAAMGLLTEYYVYRSHAGWFDTDCLNVFFVFITLYLFICFGLNTGNRRYYYLLGGMVCFAFFLLWWDQAPTSVVLICLAPLVMVLVLFYRPKGRERWVILAVALMCLAALILWRGPGIVIAPFQKTLEVFGYISKQTPGYFPNTALSVSEQKRLLFDALVAKTTGNSASFILGAAGLIWLFLKKRRQALPLAVPFAVGCLSFVFARRFLIFLNPFIALGAGFAVQQVWHLRQRFAIAQYIVPMLLVFLIFFPFQQSMQRQYWPQEIPPIVEGMDQIAQRTAEDALVWAWWDHGYPMTYWGRRATMNDGSLHSSLRTVCNALPLAAQSPRLAANFIHFYGAMGISGMQKWFAAAGGPKVGMPLLEQVLSSGPLQAKDILTQAGLTPAEQWVAFCFPNTDREIYLFLDLRVARITYWWHWFATWDVRKQDGEHAKLELLRNCHMQGDMIRGPGLQVNLKKGVVSHHNRLYYLHQVFVHEKGHQAAQPLTYAHEDGLVLVFHKQAKTAALMERPFARTLFSQLYLLHQPDSKYFSLVAHRFPYYQIWRVDHD